MKKLGLTFALAAAVATAGIPATPSSADGGATAAIIIGSVLVGGALIHLHTCGQVYCGHYWWAPPPPPPPAKGKKK